MSQASTLFSSKKKKSVSPTKNACGKRFCKITCRPLCTVVHFSHKKEAHVFNAIYKFIQIKPSYSIYSPHHLPIYLHYNYFPNYFPIHLPPSETEISSPLSSMASASSLRAISSLHFSNSIRSPPSSSRAQRLLGFNLSHSFPTLKSSSTNQVLSTSSNFTTSAFFCKNKKEPADSDSPRPSKLFFYQPFSDHALFT